LLSLLLAIVLRTAVAVAVPVAIVIALHAADWLDADEVAAAAGSWQVLLAATAVGCAWMLRPRGACA
jgi:hypothetical protein